MADEKRTAAKPESELPELEKSEEQTVPLKRVPRGSAFGALDGAVGGSGGVSGGMSSLTARGNERVPPRRK